MLSDALGVLLGLGDIEIDELGFSDDIKQLLREAKEGKVLLEEDNDDVKLAYDGLVMDKMEVEEDIGDDEGDDEGDKEDKNKDSKKDASELVSHLRNKHAKLLDEDEYCKMLVDGLCGENDEEEEEEEEEESDQDQE